MVSKKYNLWIAWFVVSFFYSYQYILRVIPSIVLPDLVSKFSLNPEIFGQFSGVYYIGYSFSHIPLGILLDRVSLKKIVPFCILLTVIGFLSFLFSDRWIYPVVGRVFTGIGSSAAILSVFKVIQTSFKPASFSRILSFSVMIGLLGAIYGGWPIQFIKEKFGFNFLVLFIGFFGCLLAVLAFIFIQPSLDSRQKKPVSLIFEIQSVLCNKNVIFFCIIAGLMVGPLEGFADIWGVHFLKVVYHFDDQIASSLPSLIFLGMCLGGPVLCSFAEIKNLHFETVLMSAVIMATVFSLLVVFQLSVFVLTPLFFLVGICCSYQILMIFKVSTFVPVDRVGLATAVANMIIMLFGYVFHSFIGKIIGFFGGFQNPRGICLGISLIPFALTLGIIVLSLVLITRKKPIPQ